MKKAALTFIASQTSGDEVQELKKKFEAIDGNGDGNITIKELGEALKDFENREELLSIMSAADLDNSGTINYTEFIAATLQQSSYVREETIGSAFGLFDMDSDGRITVDEIKQIIGGGKLTNISEE